MSADMIIQSDWLPGWLIAWVFLDTVAGFLIFIYLYIIIIVHNYLRGVGFFVRATLLRDQW